MLHGHGTSGVVSRGPRHTDTDRHTNTNIIKQYEYEHARARTSIPSNTQHEHEHEHEHELARARARTSTPSNERHMHEHAQARTSTHKHAQQRTGTHTPSSAFKPLVLLKATAPVEAKIWWGLHGALVPPGLWVRCRVVCICHTKSKRKVSIPGPPATRAAQTQIPTQIPLEGAKRHTLGCSHFFFTGQARPSHWHCWGAGAPPGRRRGCLLRGAGRGTCETTNPPQGAQIDRRARRGARGRRRSS